MLFYTNGSDTFCDKPREAKIVFTCGAELKITGLEKTKCTQGTAEKYDLTAEISCPCQVVVNATTTLTTLTTAPTTTLTTTSNSSFFHC